MQSSNRLRCRLSSKAVVTASAPGAVAMRDYLRVLDVLGFVLVGLVVVAVIVKLLRDDRSGALDDPGPLKGLGKSGEPSGTPPDRRGR